MTVEQKKNVDSSFSIFVYPLFFNLENYSDILKSTLEVYEWKLDFPDFHDQSDFRHLQYFIPYVQHFLFPKAFWKEEEKALFLPNNVFKKSSTTVSNNETKNQSLRKQVELLNTCQVVRWRWDFNDSSLLNESFELTNTMGSKNFNAIFKKVSLLLFPTGVGLLLMEISPGEKEDYTLGKLAEFNGVFNCLEDLPFGEKYGAVINGMMLRDVIDNIFLRHLSDSTREGTYSLGQSFLHHYCFACINEKINYQSSCFDNFFIGPVKLKDSFQMHDAYCAFSKNGAVILATKNSNGPAPGDQNRHWRTFYLDMYLHALYHRLSLLRFSWELSEISKLLKDNNKVQKIHRLFLDFSNKAWFSQLTNAEYGQKIWRYWGRVMETEELYNEVKIQINELDDYLERKRQGHINGLINALTIFLAPLTVITALFSSTLLKVNNPWQVSFKESLIISGVFSLLLLTGLFCLYYFSRKKRGG